MLDSEETAMQKKKLVMTTLTIMVVAKSYSDTMADEYLHRDTKTWAIIRRPSIKKRQNISWAISNTKHIIIHYRYKVRPVECSIALTDVLMKS